MYEHWLQMAQPCISFATGRAPGEKVYSLCVGKARSSTGSNERQSLYCGRSAHAPDASGKEEANPRKRVQNLSLRVQFSHRETGQGVGRDVTTLASWMPASNKLGCRGVPLRPNQDSDVAAFSSLRRRAIRFCSVRRLIPSISAACLRFPWT